jgi:hypothetical protein
MTLILTMAAAAFLPIALCLAAVDFTRAPKPVPVRISSKAQG